MAERIGSIIVAGLILYFGIQATDAANYAAGLSSYMMDKGVLGLMMGLAYAVLPFLIRVIVIGTIVLALFDPGESSDNSGLGALLIGWAFMGWWVGGSFHKALLAKHACTQNSTFGFGCYIHGPIFSLLLYSVLSFLIVIAMTGVLIEFVRTKLASSRDQDQNDKQG